MPRQNIPIPSMNRWIVNVFRDEWGRVIAQLDTGECVVIRPDGSVDKLRFNENIQLGSGEMYNPAMSMGPNPVILVGVCQACRNSLFGGSAHGLFNTEAGRRCRDCQALLCPKHSILCGDDNWRCRNCARTRPLKQALKHIFFKREDA